jgi:hypothetical protein
MIKKLPYLLTHSLLFVFALLLTNQAFAGGAVINAKVTEVRIDADGKGMVFFDQPIGGTPPSCVISYYASALAFNASTAGGKAIMAAALTAKATGAKTIVYGSGACGNYGAYVEDWSTGHITQ